MIHHLYIDIYNKYLCKIIIPIHEFIWLCRNIPIPAGSSIEIMSGNKIVMAYNVASGAGDKLQAQSSAAASLDVIVSYMEIA